MRLIFLRDKGFALPFDEEGFWRSGRLRPPVSIPDGLSQIGPVGVRTSVVMALAAWIGMSSAEPKLDHGLRLEPAEARAHPRPVLHHAPATPGPATAQAAIDAIAKAYGEPVGIAIQDVGAGWAVAVNGDRYFPQQSVSKTWVALSVLDAVDEGKLALDAPVVMQASDRSVFNEPLGRSIDDSGEGYQTTVEGLLKHALIQSDNSANDTLIRLVGLDTVRDTLELKGLPGIKLGADERHLQSTIAGLTWDPVYGEGRNFEQARAKLPVEQRQNALDRYLTDPLDGATPTGVVQALSALSRGELLSASSSETMLGILKNVRTGPRRLKGGLQPGWSIAHKTGTGQDFKGASVGINDIGLLTAPDGHMYAVAVFIPHTRQPNGRRLAMMQSVTQAVSDHWAGKPFHVPSFEPAPEPARAKAKRRTIRVAAAGRKAKA